MRYMSCWRTKETKIQIHIKRQLLISSHVKIYMLFPCWEVHTVKILAQRSWKLQNLCYPKANLSTLMTLIAIYYVSHDIFLTYIYCYINIVTSASELSLLLSTSSSFLFDDILTRKVKSVFPNSKYYFSSHNSLNLISARGKFSGKNAPTAKCQLWIGSRLLLA